MMRTIIGWLTGWNVKSKHIAMQLSVQNTEMEDNMGENVTLRQNLCSHRLLSVFFFPDSISCTIEMNLYRTGNSSICNL